MTNKEISSVLKSVTKPGRYIGGEYNAIKKDKAAISCRFAFCFPDTYEIGMSNLGVRILYETLNRNPDVWCERVYAPWTDMQEKMKQYAIPLAAVESGDPLSEFGIVAFSLQYELCYTAALNMMKLAGYPLFASERHEDAPVFIAGGPCVYNPEPVADFFDLINIGEGEEVLSEIAELYVKMKKDGSYTKTGFLREASHIEGVYIPSLYDVSYNDDGTIAAFGTYSELLESCREFKNLVDLQKLDDADESKASGEKEVE